ncbi:F-box/kelch-repeat protein At3g06240-like [Spinacia oleracea]|uniref:F-box/kelch-repeat protein At3g06240-like n=1 Tax=Spinacia oleracea TaxID=3562 RepID=A0ABM3QVI5_SPIOL|nr:F-box/kelch-repeat protein At3g06240-like [Spinacia oleracea]
MVDFSLYNPVTGSRNTVIPNYLTAGCFDRYGCRCMLGFGYDRTSDDYKIFYAMTTSSQPSVQSWIYSLKHNSWRRIIQPPPPLPIPLPFPHPRTKMVYYDNGLHWLVWDFNTNASYIFRFDLATEEYHQVEQPYYDDDDTFHVLAYRRRELLVLTELRGCLHLVEYTTSPSTRYASSWSKESEEKEVYYMRMWVMKNNYDGGSLNRSWVKLIDCLSLIKQVVSRVYTYTPPLPCAYSENGKEILIVLGERVFVKYDFSRGKLQSVKLCGLPNDWKYTYGRDFISWTSSFVSPSS